MVLHFLVSDDKAIETIRKLQSWTKPGGIHVITSYLKDGNLSNDYTFLLELTMLQSLYDDWEIVLYTESYARTLGNTKNLKDFTKMLSGQKGFKAAWLIARK